MSEWKHIRITGGPRLVKIEIDGQNVSDMCTRVALTADVHGVVTARLTLIGVADVDVVGKVVRRKVRRDARP